MTDSEKREAARKIYNKYKDNGKEKQHCHSFWIELIENILGVPNVTDYLNFEKTVEVNETIKNIDVYIPETRILIEQKSSGIPLDKKIKQSDNVELTAYEQAKRYNDELIYDEKARWIITSNFDEIWIYNMNEPCPQPIKIYLVELQDKYPLLDILINHKIKKLSNEMELSIKAGNIVGEIYDALLKQYDDPANPDSLKSLNMLCVRLVFCLYAEDAGIFGRKNIFHDFLEKYPTDDWHEKLAHLFKVLDQDPKKGEREKYLKDDLKEFPYVNGGLFKDEDIEIPLFTDELRDLILCKASEEFNWSQISPTIFGAVFESTLNPETRRKGGMHYTSVENIHKVINPLFMDDLEDEFNHIIYENALSHDEYKREEFERENQFNDEYAKLSSIKDENERLKRKKEIDEQKRQLRYKKSGLSRRRNSSINEQIKELQTFQKKLSELKFLDPACGSGNFLTETYISLRRLENKILSEIQELKTGISNNSDISGQIEMANFFKNDNPIKISISNFYGIEINDFAVTVGKTALWIAESQMMKETESILHMPLEFFPLRTHAQIIEKNALQIDWNELVDANNLNYIMGNPPFVGSSIKEAAEQQKKDKEYVFGKKRAGKLDYVACWYKKAADYIKNTAIQVAFVSTNSITQGEQVRPLWEDLLNDSIKINFAYRTFRWDSEAHIKAQVHCVIISISNFDRAEKFIFENGIKKKVSHINGYLIDYPNFYITSRGKEPKGMPKLTQGSKPWDNGGLVVSKNEKNELLAKYPHLKQYIKPYIGSKEFINNIERYCLWLLNAEPTDLRNIPEIKERLQKVISARKSSPTKVVQKQAATPTLFSQIRQPNNDYIIIPETSSSSRIYIPMGFMSKDVIASNSCMTLQNSNLYIFGILQSNLHMAWVRTLCGRWKSDYRYTPSLYNNFPWIEISKEQQHIIELTAQGILDARKEFPRSSLADLYDPKNMKEKLYDAHMLNNKEVMKAYGIPIKYSESECVSALMQLSQELANKK